MTTREMFEAKITNTLISYFNDLSVDAWVSEWDRGSFEGDTIHGDWKIIISPETILTKGILEFELTIYRLISKDQWDPEDGEFIPNCWTPAVFEYTDIKLEDFIF